MWSSIGGSPGKLCQYSPIPLFRWLPWKSVVRYPRKSFLCLPLSPLPWLGWGLHCLPCLWSSAKPCLLYHLMGLVCMSCFTGFCGYLEKLLRADVEISSLVRFWVHLGSALNSSLRQFYSHTLLDQKHASPVNMWIHIDRVDWSSGGTWVLEGPRVCCENGERGCCVPL